MFFFTGIIYPFFANPLFANLVKMQIPLQRFVRIFVPILFKFVWRQSGFAFFGASTSVGALFYFCRKGEEKMKRTVATLLLLCSCACLCSCGNSSSSSGNGFDNSPEYYQNAFESCHSTYEHKQALYSYDINNDNHLSDYELELFANAHPRFVNDKQFVAWVEDQLIN